MSKFSRPVRSVTRRVKRVVKSTLGGGGSAKPRPDPVPVPKSSPVRKVADKAVAADRDADVSKVTGEKQEKRRILGLGTGTRGRAKSVLGEEAKTKKKTLLGGY
jgi:hypothetical protein